SSRCEWVVNSAPRLTRQWARDILWDLRSINGRHGMGNFQRRIAAISLALCSITASGATAQVNIVRIVDPVVSNTDPNLQNTDFDPNGETSIAVNPLNPNEIVITSFTFDWNGNAPIWHSTNGGRIWTKRFVIPPPPGHAAET